MQMAVQSVLGPVDASQLGVVLPHEHILVDFTRGVVEHPLEGTTAAEKEKEERIKNLELTMENQGLIRRFPYSVMSNLQMNEPKELTNELQLYKVAGGGTICELSVVGMRCDPHRPELLAEMSRDTGVNIVHATGFYLDGFLPEWARLLSIREMADHMIGEISHGVGVRGVKCGVMYIGCSWPMTETERRALQAAAITQKETGVAMVIHTGRNIQSPLDIHKILTDCGADPAHICLSHLDRTFPGHSEKKLLELATRGCYLNFSLFGKECSHYQYAHGVDMPSDAQRIGHIKTLIDAGFADIVLMSHDVVTKHELVKYGGYGYRHILEHVLPKMADRGISQENIQKIVRGNPQNFLCNTHSIVQD